MIPGTWEEAAQTARAFSGQRGFLTASISQGPCPLQKERIRIVELPLLVQYRLSLQRARSPFSPAAGYHVIYFMCCVEKGKSEYIASQSTSVMFDAIPLKRRGKASSKSSLLDLQMRSVCRQIFTRNVPLLPHSSMNC